MLHFLGKSSSLVLDKNRNLYTLGGLGGINYKVSWEISFNQPLNTFPIAYNG